MIARFKSYSASHHPCTNVDAGLYKVAIHHHMIYRYDDNSDYDDFLLVPIMISMDTQGTCDRIHSWLAHQFVFVAATSEGYLCLCLCSVPHFSSEYRTFVVQ